MERTNREYQGLTQAVINLAEALRDGTAARPDAVAKLLRENAETLVAWTEEPK